MTDATRDPGLPALLLLTERDALLPILRAADPADLDRPTCLPGWSVRDVLAHCAAAFTMTAEHSWHGFSPEENQRDVDERNAWPVGDVLAELESGYATTAAAATAAGGQLDGLVLGEWLHGGDVREALGLPDAYASAGADDALVLLAERSRERGVPRTTVTLTDGNALKLGGPDGEATLHTDTATLFRMIAGRRTDPVRYELRGANAASYVLFS